MRRAAARCGPARRPLAESVPCLFVPRGRARIFAGGTAVHVLPWLARQPFILLFLVVAGGFALGRLKIKGIGLGATAAALVLALAVSVLAAGRGAKIAVPE